MATEITVGIAGAAGDGLDRTGDTLARTAGRLGLHVFTYNSYQSIIRGGHTWLKLRISEDKVDNHGDRLNVLIALNQDSIERHAPEVESGGAIIFNSAKLSCDSSLVREGVTLLPLPIPELTKDMGRLLPVMQNTVTLGALLHLIGFDVEITKALLSDTFRHKGEQIIEQNTNVLSAGHAHAVGQAEPLKGLDWNFTHKRRPLVNGNQMIALGAVAAGCKLFSAYPMSPATSILHWLASHSEKVGVLVKQAEDELAVVNIAIGAGHAGVRAMCATSGGGFALMTEAIGMAAMLETPVVIVNVMRGGPSTGLPTKTEQGDLNQAFGASQGDYPRMIVAPVSALDCYNATVEAFNIAEKYQLPVILLSDLLLAEHRSTIDPGAISADVPIDRGEWVTELTPQNSQQGRFKRYALNDSGVSPRARPGAPDLMHVSGTDDHDETGVLISDEHTNAAIRRKMHEKRMKKMDAVLRDLAAPELEGPADAEVTLVGWGSTWSVIQEAAARLTADGLKTNQLQFKYLYPFHAKEAQRILGACKRAIVVENNYTGQFERHMRAESGVTIADHIRRYDGEPIEPTWLVERVRAVVAGEPEDLQVTEAEAREMGYHYVRLYQKDKTRPGKVERLEGGEWGEPVWNVEIIGRAELEPQGNLVIGRDTGSILAWQPREAGVEAAQ